MRQWVATLLLWLLLSVALWAGSTELGPRCPDEGTRNLREDGNPVDALFAG